MNAQGYVALIAAAKFKEAYELIRERCPLPAACGRVCQHPCEDHCNRGEIDQAVSVRDLKRFVADYIQPIPISIRRPSPRRPSWTRRLPSSAAARPA